MKQICSLFLSFLFVFPAFAEEVFPDYKQGTGANYKMKVDGDPADVTLAFVSRSDKRIVIEIDMKVQEKGGSTIPIHMVQQFHLGLVNGKVQILEGYMKIPNIPKPQKLPPEYLKGYSGAKMEDFVIGSQSEVDAMKVSDGQLRAMGKMLKTTHYRKESNGQVIQFWVSEAIKPLSLVMMTSQGSKKEQNYTLKLHGLVKNYKRQIDPAASEPLNAMGRMFLPLLLETSTFIH